MKKIYIIFTCLFAVNAYSAVDIVCMGNSNTNQLIQIELELDARLGKVKLENSTHDWSVSNSFTYVWQNQFENQLYTNTLNRIDGTLTVVAEGAGENNTPLIRAILSCKNTKDILF